MASLEQLIKINLNPFDPTTFKPGNFWKETQDQSLEVTSIHEHVVDSVEVALAQVAHDRKTRSLMLLGDSGSGKSHLLGRIKRRLNSQACFAYIGPWSDSQFIWRHVLRQTVDSLMAVPEGQSESQLMRWLKGLDFFKRGGIAKRLIGERGVFIRDMRASFPTAYQGKEFFSVIYALLDPDLQLIATDWLRGEDLDDEDLHLLKVRNSIDSEDAAQKMMSNLGWLADSTQPVVLCFDNLDNVPDMPNGQTGLKAMFNVNTMIHNEKLKNFLVVISLITSNWKANEQAIEYANLARVDQQITLPKITTEQAIALWTSRLAPLHSKATPKPASPIAPLTREWLDFKYPGGKLLPRLALMSAEQLIRDFKKTGKLPEIPDQTIVDDGTGEILPEPITPTSDESDRASFELMWQKEFKETGSQLHRISQFSSPELIRRLQEALEALDISNVQHAILSNTKYSSYSLGYEQSDRTCVVWTEDGNLTSFCNVMKACKKVKDAGGRDRIYLIRKEKLGTPKNRGYQIWQEIFADAKHKHLKPDLVSVQYLETYHRLVNAAAGGELVIGAKTPHVKDLQGFVRESGVLSNCSLLKQLSVVPSAEGDDVGPPVITPDPDRETGTPPGPSAEELAVAERYILNIMTTQSLVGMQVLVENTQEQVPTMDSDTVVGVIHSLSAAQRVQILDPNARLENQILCHVPA
ncbi:MAG: P-loop NTPase fold protein [Cyanobacteria bacterium J06581_3]